MKTIKALMLSGIVMFSLLTSVSTVNAQEKSKKDGEKDIFVVVEEMPKFKAGDIKTFQKWVGEQVEYPKEALKNGISGIVYCEFVIQLDGTLGSIKIKKPEHELLDNEVLRVVKSSPKWTPGKQRGKDVLVKMNIPVSFKLD